VSGALALYLGFRHAAFSVAGPLSAVAAAGFSVLAGLLLGERPTALALTGIALALPAIVGVSMSARVPDSGQASAEFAASGRSAGAALSRAPTGVGYGLVAGVCFALLFIGLNRAGSGSGLWPVFFGQVAALTAVGCLAAFTGDLRLPEGRGGWLAAVAGVTGGPGTILYFLATHHGLLAVAARTQLSLPGGDHHAGPHGPRGAADRRQAVRAVAGGGFRRAHRGRRRCWVTTRPEPRPGVSPRRARLVATPGRGCLH